MTFPNTFPSSCPRAGSGCLAGALVAILSWWSILRFRPGACLASKTAAYKVTFPRVHELAFNHTHPSRPRHDPYSRTSVEYYDAMILFSSLLLALATAERANAQVALTYPSNTPPNATFVQDNFFGISFELQIINTLSESLRLFRLGIGAQPRFSFNQLARHPIPSQGPSTTTCKISVTEHLIRYDFG